MKKARILLGKASCDQFLINVLSSIDNIEPILIINDNFGDSQNQDLIDKLREFEVILIQNVPDSLNKLLTLEYSIHELDYFIPPYVNHALFEQGNESKFCCLVGINFSGLKPRFWFPAFSRGRPPPQYESPMIYHRVFIFIKNKGVGLKLTTYYFILTTMKQSQLFTKTRREAPKDEVSKNAQLLIRAGFIHKEMAGVYSFLPLGLRVIENIKNIIREELNHIGGQEMKMTTLQKKDVWEKTNRWDDKVVDDWFKTDLKNGTNIGLAFTHEEPLTNIMTDFISSYKDLPVYAYQFQTKFRNELRAKSGIMRGREFLMKDLYDFSLDEEEHKKFYESMKEVYMKIFTRIGIGEQTFLTMSSGGSFSKYSFEFQTITDAGEDIIFYDEDKKIAINKDDYTEEIFTDFNLNKDDFNFKEAKSVEVGDIYTLGEKYSKALGLTYKNEKGEEKNVYMGSYGIGVPRLMGTIVEIFADEKGMIWPESVAPFKIHLLSLGQNEKAEEIYNQLQEADVEVLFDDRNKKPGEKFADSDLIGIPYRVVVGGKSLEAGGVELKKRDSEEGEIISVEDLINRVK